MNLYDKDRKIIPTEEILKMIDKEMLDHWTDYEWITDNKKKFMAAMDQFIKTAEERYGVQPPAARRWFKHMFYTKRDENGQIQFAVPKWASVIPARVWDKWDDPDVLDDPWFKDDEDNESGAVTMALFVGKPDGEKKK